MWLKKPFLHSTINEKSGFLDYTPYYLVRVYSLFCAQGISPVCPGNLSGLGIEAGSTVCQASTLPTIHLSVPVKGCCEDGTLKKIWRM